MVFRSKRMPKERPGFGRGAVAAALVAAGLALAAAPAEAQMPATGQTGGKKKIPLTISGYLSLWLPNFDGVIQSGEETAPGTEIRLDTHLDLEAHPEVYVFGLGLGDVRYGKLAAEFIRFNAPGNKVLRRDLSFSGVDFLQPETVHSEFKVELDRVTVSYIQDIRGAYILTYEVGLAFLRWKSSIENRHITKRASEDARATLPLTGLHAIFPLADAFEIRIGFSGVFFQTSDDDVDLVDAYAEFKFVLARYALLGLGYRYIRLEGELDLEGGKTGSLEMVLSGVYMSVGVKF
jgi:hypothetical protein